MGEDGYEALRKTVGKLRNFGLEGWTIGDAVADASLKYLTLLEAIGARPPKIAQCYEDSLTFSWMIEPPYGKAYFTVGAEDDPVMFTPPASPVDQEGR